MVTTKAMIMMAGKMQIVDAEALEPSERKLTIEPFRKLAKSINAIPFTDHITKQTVLVRKH